MTCTTCRKRRPQKGKLSCKHCLSVSTEGQKRRRLEREAAGRCYRCGGPQNTDGNYCKKCRRYYRKHAATRVAQLLAQGKCSRCGAEPLTTKLMGPACAEKERQRSTAKAAALRLEVLVAYGGPKPACACCGEAIAAFLTIDHVDGGGNAHRKLVGKVYYWVKKNKYPAGFQVLCFNCNMARSHHGGTCPHSIRRALQLTS